MLSISAENIREVTVVAAVAADLNGKHGYVVEQVAATQTYQLYTSGIPYAVLMEELTPGGGVWKAALINGGGIVPCIADGAINTAAYVKAANGGKVTAGSSTNLCIGVKRKPNAASADGSVIGVDLGLVTMP